METLTQRFVSYFSREVAQQAARTIANGSEVAFQILGADGKPWESFTFTRESGKNTVIPGPAKDAQMTFTLTPGAAEAILADPSDDIAVIGLGILRLIFSQEKEKKISIKLHGGFMSLFSRGYFGVIGAGGSRFAADLAKRGFDGLQAIRAAFKKLKE